MDWGRIAAEAGILVIDDDPGVVGLLDAMLRRVGYARIASASTPGRALDLVRTFRPDVILLDLHLGETSGLDLLAEISELIPPRSFLPVIVITGDCTDEARLQALLLGARDVITKPFDQVETMLRIRARLETRFLFQDLESELGELRRAVAAGGR